MLLCLIKPDHRYSYSQLASFSECPFGYYLKNIEEKEEAPNAFAEQGILIHKILDEWANGKLKKENLAKVYEQRYPDVVVTSFPRILTSKGYAEKTFQQGLEYFKNFQGFPGFSIVSAEEEFKMPLKLTDGTTRQFLAYVDLILRNDFTGGLCVLDHKSKSWASFRKERDSMYKQQYLYSYFVHEKYGEWPELLMFSLFKEGGKTDEREFSMDEYNKTLEWATKAIHTIESYDILDWMECKEQKTVGKPDMFCAEICGTRQYCPYSIRRST